MKLRKIKLSVLFLTLAATLNFTAAAATPTASEILAKAIAALKAAPGIDAQFTASTQGSHAKGSIQIGGNCFRLTTNEMSVWFDGRTQWAYSPAMGEVNISEPSLAELGQINPFAVVDGLQKGYKARRLKAPSGLDKLELTPADKKRAAYAKVVLTLNASTSMPAHISVTASDGTRADIAISSLKKTAQRPRSFFTFNPKSHPGVKIVDLR